MTPTQRLLGPTMDFREPTWSDRSSDRHQELMTVKTNVHIRVKVICTSWINAVKTGNILLPSTEVLLAIVYIICQTGDVIVKVIKILQSKFLLALLQMT